MPPLELSVRPTRAGQAHPAVQIADTQEAADAKWKELPTLFAVNEAPVSSLKPGASLLLSGTEASGREHVVLAWQRYGRGKSLVLPVQDTWLWRMHATMAVEDTTHQFFWQRLTRWLVDGVPEPVMVTVAPDRVQPGEPVTITAEVFDGEYRGINDGRVFAHVTATIRRCRRRADGMDGRAGRRVPRALHAVRKRPLPGCGRWRSPGRRRDRPRDDESAGRVRAMPSTSTPAMRASLLRRLSEETGGRFFRAADTAVLADAISYSGRGVTVVEERELWDMPIVLLAVLGLMATEWTTRRRWGLA